MDIGRRNIEGASRLGGLWARQLSRGGQVGGTLGDAWSYDAYALYYHTSLLHANENHLTMPPSTTRFR